MVMLDKPHSKNAESPIVVTPSGISILVRLSQKSKVARSIDVILFDRVTLVNDLQLEKHDSPIYKTLSGIMILFNPSHP